MKPARKISAIILAAMLIASLMAAASLTVSAKSGDEPNPSGDYLKFTVNVSKTDPGLSYYFITFKTINYMMEEGDKVEYDVWISNDENGWGFIDSQGIKDVQGENFRDSGGADDMGVGIHPGQDMSEYAFGQWYHRVIEIPEAFWGKEMPVFQLSMHTQNDELEYSGYAMYDNIVITDSNGAAKLVIFRDASDWDGTTSKGPVSPDGPTATLECLAFTQEELDGFKAAKEAKAAEAASKEAAKASEDLSRAESREQASIEASKKQAEEDAAAAAEAEGTTTAAEEDKKGDEEGSNNLILIICIAGGGVVLVIIIVVIALGGKKKKPAENGGKDNKEKKDK